MSYHPSIAAYFAAAERDDTDALVECFADDAVVFDEDQTWQGRSQITQWRKTVATKFDYTIEVRDLVAWEEPTTATASTCEPI